MGNTCKTGRAALGAGGCGAKGGSGGSGGSPAAASCASSCLTLALMSVNLIMNALSTEVLHRHAKNINSDTWRRQQLLRSTSRPGHPFNSFSTGNVNTLLHQPKVS